MSAPDDPLVSPSALELELARRRGQRRLLDAVARPPLRYAPFFRRLGELWDLNEEGVSEVLSKLETPRGFRRSLLPGVSRLAVTGGPRLARAELELVRLAPGAGFPAHRHTGDETVFVLEGGYRDGELSFGPGDTQEMPAGSEHALRAGNEPCVAAVVSRGYAFTGFPLRTLQALAGAKR